MIINNKIEGVSAIISGHDHISTQKPLISNGIPIIQAGGEELHYLGRLDLNFRHKDGKWVNYGFNGRLYSADGVEKDKEIQRIIDNYKSKPISKLKSKK
jgi:5'-nucleotidase